MMMMMMNVVDVDVVDVLYEGDEMVSTLQYTLQYIIGVMCDV